MVMVRWTRGSHPNRADSPRLDSDRHADVVSANLRLGMELGVDRTPTVFVSKGGRSVRVSRWNEFEAYKSVIDRFVEEDAEDGL